MKKLFTTSTGWGKNNSYVFRLQNSKSNFIALFGSDQTVSVFDRHGEKKVEVPLPGEAVEMVWDCDGENLAILDDKTSSVTLWDALTFKISQLNTGIKDHLSALAWSVVGNRLAVGSEKGNLVIYNHKTTKKISLLGKHMRKITCAVWNRGNVLALAGDDKVISINSADGDLIKQCTVRDLPSQLQFADLKRDDELRRAENYISCITGQKNLFILNLDDIENPIELAFQQRYGDVMAYRWFGDGYIMIGFSAGYLVVISTERSELGKEIYQVRDHKDGLFDLAVSATLNRCATTGDHSVKIHDLLNVRELTAIIELEEDSQAKDVGSTDRSVTFRSLKNACQLQWSDDGQLMAVATPRQLLHVFLSQLPMLASVTQSKISCLSARLSSLLEVTLEPLPFSHLPVNPEFYKVPRVLTTEVEPTFLGLGSKYLAIGINNRAWFYELKDTGTERVSEVEYLDVVDRVSVGDQYAASCGPAGKLTLHWIDPKTFPVKESATNPSRSMESQSTSCRDSRVFPEPNQMNCKVTGFHVTSQFLIFATNTGRLCYFHLDDWAYLNEFQHVVGIVSVFPNMNGTRVAFIDDRSCAYIYNPVIEELIELPDFSPSAVRILWDMEEQVNPLATHTFRLYSHSVIQGTTSTEAVAQSNEASGIDSSDPAATAAHSERKSGSARKRSAKREQAVLDLNKLGTSELQAHFDQAMRAGCFEDAWVFADRLENQRLWSQLGMASLRVMQFDIAIRAFRRSNHPGLVLAVQRIQGIEDEFLLSGYVAMLLKEFDQAQELFLASTRPTAALEMRRDLLHWDAALQLARKLAPQEIPMICREYALEMECIGDFMNALMHFERALTKVESTESGYEPEADENDYMGREVVQFKGDLSTLDGLNTHWTKSKDAGLYCTEEEDSAWREHLSLCNAGIARNAIRLGDTKRGIQLAKESNNPALEKECADILEQSKQWQEAAALYELAGCYEAAVSVYLRCKNYKKAGDLLLTKVVNAPRLQLQYAKAREADGAYREAVVAYEAAHDWDSVVRLQLDKLSNPEEAVRVVHETKSIEGAKMIAQYFTRINDHTSAIRFLVMSKCLDAAFELARKHKKMELYAEVIGSDASTSEYQSIACYFESEKNWYLAGKFYLLAKQYEKAVRHLLRAPYSGDSPALDLALEAVGMAGDTRLTHLLIVYLMGETDGVPKDARHLFRLYMVLKQYKEAARTAVIIAREEQTAGNYRSAHDLLYSMVQELRRRELRVPAEMTDNLALLHSYILAKGNHVIKNDLTVCPGCQFPANYSDMMSFVENTESPTCPMCSAELKRDTIRRITDPSKVLNAWIVNMEEPEEQDVTKQ
ncbi:hypothetical protein D915_008124 [Fasciola hepatica]|uniref:WD repeat-containing protein 19 n=1 Tax=Fasciola hepatica TaxID=6192 RepID=A0A4E0RY58_FASHE|nr:hypothetical protein D915_008124 [Fasciola hepatica]